MNQCYIKDNLAQNLEVLNCILIHFLTSSKIAQYCK